MKLVLPLGEAQKQLKRDMQAHPGCKFVLFAGPSGGEIAHLFPYHLTHSHVVDYLFKNDPTLIFVGAGFVMNGIPDWGSQSCMQRFGRDRPRDEGKQEALLDELQEEIAERI